VQIDQTLLLSQLQGLLAGFGPWGILAAAGIMLFLRWRQGRTPGPIAPSPILPQPGPAPIAPPPGPSTGRPLIDLILGIIGGAAKKQAPHLTEEEAIARALVKQASSAIYTQERIEEEARKK